jgi:7,8-dihydropterin-6-yl-methyl-4-(beta-D-ribofuranosyl)aminobenzene 5'-phosphate synthase
MNGITIKIIYDNCKAEEGFQEGWGFSCLVDTGRRKILFDTGANSEAFFSNLEKLGIRCEEITDVVCSHKHSDHIAAFKDVAAKLKKDSRIFLPKKFRAKALPVHTEIVEDFKEIDSGIYSIVLKGGLFLYEQALILQTPKGLAIITGCAHPGIIQLLHEAKNRFNQPIHLVLGGLHLFRKSQTQIDAIIDQFKALNVNIAAPCHCSGSHAIKRFEQAYGPHFHKIGSGTTLILDKVSCVLID